jgi:DNA-binding transcriptional MocR family regulator
LDDIVSELGPWHAADGPLYVKLAVGLRRLLERGLIGTGSALPPERALARRLAVSRNTVSAAYAQLRSDGWVDARQGSATTVTAAGFSAVGAHRSNALFSTLLDEHRDIIDLTVAVPDAAPFVREVTSNPGRFLSGSEVASGHGYYPQGYPPLREAVAKILTDSGLPTTNGQLIITSGGQQAISLAIRGLTRPGDRIGVEEVSFPGAIDAIRLSAASLVPVPHTENGVDLGSLDEVLDGNPLRLLYVIPTFHNPTGATLSLPDRKRLVATIVATGTTTIDDMTLSDLDFSGLEPRPLATIDPDAPIISVGSLSKVHWGGLRVGWLRANESLIAYLAGVKATADLGTSAVSQVIAGILLERHQETREWRNARLEESLDACAAALESLLPEWRWRRPGGGPELWIELPGTDTMAFAQLMMRHGVGVVAGSLLAARPGVGSNHIRIAYYRPPDDMIEAVQRMAAVWRTLPAPRHKTPHQ